MKEIFIIEKMNGRQKETKATLITNRSRKMMWTDEEDNLIIELVKQHGSKDWNPLINFIKAKNPLFNKTTKQLRQRFKNSLQTNIKKFKWSPEEDKILFEKHLMYGNKWTNIASYLPGRKAVKYIGTDQNKFIFDSQEPINPEKIYKLIKRENVSFSTLDYSKIISIIKKNDDLSTRSSMKDNILMNTLNFSNSSFISILGGEVSKESDMSVEVSKGEVNIKDITGEHQTQNNINNIETITESDESSVKLDFDKYDKNNKLDLYPSNELEKIENLNFLDNFEYFKNIYNFSLDSIDDFSLFNRK